MLTTSIRQHAQRNVRSLRAMYGGRLFKAKPIYVCLAMVLLAGWVVTSKTEAQDLSLFNFEYYPTVGFDIEGAEGVEAAIYKIEASLILQRSLGRSRLITQLQGGYLETDITNAGNSVDSNPLYTLGIALTWIRPLSTRWVITASANPRLASDFKEIGSEDFYINGALFLTRVVRRTLQYGLGVSISSDFGEPVVFPLVQLRWSTSKMAVNLLLPTMADVAFTLGPSTFIGVQSVLSGTEYNTNPDDEIDIPIQFSTFVVGPYLEQHLAGSISLKLQGGTTIWRRFEVDPDVFDDKIDQENSVFVKAALVLRP